VTRLSFTEWLPDLADQENPGSTEALNVIPSPDGFRPLLSLTTITDALDSVCIGGISVISNTGTIYNYAGSTNSLYELRNGFWINRLNHFYTATPGALSLTGVNATVGGLAHVSYDSIPGESKLSGVKADVVIS
jgi:hypothetical protein